MTVSLGHRGAVHAMPIVAMALVVVLLGVFLWVLDRNEREEEAHALIKDILWVEQNLRFQLASDVDKLEHLAETLGREDGDALSLAPVMRHIVTTNPAVEQILWLDANGRTVAAMPPAGGDGDGIGDGSGAQPRGEAFKVARSLGRRVYGAPYRLPQRGAGFDVVIPVFGARGFAGALAGVFSIDAILANHVPWWFAQRYQLEVVNADGTVLGAKSHLAVAEPRRSHTLAYDPPGRGLTLVATVYQTDANATRNILVAAIFALTASALWSLWAVRRHIRGRVTAERALREEHAFRKAMEDSLTAGMRARDMEGRITYVNPAFCRMVGWPAEELIGRGPPMPYWPPEEMGRCEDVFRSVMAGRVSPEGFELRFMRHDGERFDALVYEAPLIDAGGRQTGWMASVLDITERKRAADLARQQQEKLQQTARLITMGEMASTLAHELNQPLSAIASYSTGCLNRLHAGPCSAAELAPPLEKLANQARRAGQIIRRVHDFVRKREPNVAAVNLTAVIEDSVALMASDARKHGVRITVQGDERAPPVLADRILVQQVLLNLMRNAIEAMAQTPREARELGVAVEVHEDSVTTRIRDRGCGIAPEVAERLFSPFFTTKTEGMGMGLNICRSIVEHHKGRLWYDVHPGGNGSGGTTFQFTLPTAGKGEA
ncbi:ATP-binding protein [Azospirillum sp.]|uniref:ATP-binding protein n=1 Tax=Azospirillum sp. TaxID=34012 RepID=UPI002D32C915|nr:ATP-binding protein [Azospirillum sp.]HYD71015.1 ATP-binding protein [Azospirillum sp.]